MLLNIRDKNLLKFFKYLIPYKWSEIAILLLTFASILIAYAPPSLMGWFIDDIITNKKVNTIFLYLILVVVVQLLSQIFSSSQSFLFSRTSQKVIFDIRLEVYRHLQRVKLNYFSNNKTGEILTKILGDVETVSNGISQILIVILTNSISLIISFFYLFFTNKLLTLIALLFMPLYIIIQKKYKVKLKNASENLREAYGIFSSAIFESISGTVEIRIFCNEKFEQLKFVQKLKKIYRENLNLTKTKIKSDFMINLAVFICPTVILSLGGYQIIKGALTIGQLMAFSAILGKLNSSVSQLINSNLNFQNVIVSIERIFSLLEEDIEKDGEDPVTNTESIGTIEFKNVSFSYDGIVKVIDNLNFKINKGESIAIVGENGSGKSSIINLLLKNYSPDKGQILINGMDLKTIKKKSFLKNIGVIRQDNFLFNASIFDNIIYGNRKASREQVEQAARDADIYSFITSLPDGFDTVVGERGVKLSGGQRQKICLARAIISNPSILVMDEATSSVDPQSEKEIYKALGRAFKGRTSILITHKLSNLVNVDRILTLEKEGIKEHKGYNEYILKNQRLLIKETGLNEYPAKQLL